MKNISIMGILRLFKKKSFKLGALSVAFAGLMISGSSSFAKYQHVEFGDIFHADVTKPPIPTTPSAPLNRIYIKNVEVVQDSNKIDSGVNYILPTEVDANVNVSNNSSITYKVTVHNKTDVTYWYIGQTYEGSKYSNNLIKNGIAVTTKDKLNDSSATFDTNDWVPAQTERDFYVTYTYASNARGDITTLINFKFDIKMDSVYDGFLAVLNDKITETGYNYLANEFDKKFKEDGTTVISNIGDDKTIFDNIFDGDLKVVVDGVEKPVTILVRRENVDGTANGDSYSNGGPTGCEYTLYITVDNLKEDGTTTATVYAISYSYENGVWHQLGELYEGTCNTSDFNNAITSGKINDSPADPFWTATPKSYDIIDGVFYLVGQEQGDQYDKYYTLEQLMSCTDHDFYNGIDNSGILKTTYDILNKNLNSTQPSIVLLRAAFENLAPFYYNYNNGQQFQMKRDATRSRVVPLLQELQEALKYYNQTVAAAANKN